MFVNKFVNMYDNYMLSEDENRDEKFLQSTKNLFIDIVVNAKGTKEDLMYSQYFLQDIISNREMYDREKVRELKKLGEFVGNYLN